MMTAAQENLELGVVSYGEMTPPPKKKKKKNENKHGYAISSGRI